jgi:hypothetical protein
MCHGSTKPGTGRKFRVYVDWVVIATKPGEVIKIRLAEAAYEADLRVPGHSELPVGLGNRYF